MDTKTTDTAKSETVTAPAAASSTVAVRKDVKVLKKLHHGDREFASGEVIPEIDTASYDYHKSAGAVE